MFQEILQDAALAADDFLGQVVLIRDSAIEDPTYRGDWTVRTLSYEGGPAAGSGDSQHRYLLTPANGDEPIAVTVPERGKLRIMAKLIALLPER